MFSKEMNKVEYSQYYNQKENKELIISDEAREMLSKRKEDKHEMFYNAVRSFYCAILAYMNKVFKDIVQY